MSASRSTPYPPRNAMYDLAGRPGWRDFRASGRAYRARLFRDDVEALERRLEEPYLEKLV